MSPYIKGELISQKLKMIEEYERIKTRRGKYFKSVKEMCKYYNISRKTFYKWLKRFKEGNREKDSLLPRSRRPKTNKRMPSKEIERLIVKMRRKLGYSALLISTILRRRGISKISEFGVYKVFKRYNVRPRSKTKREPNHYEKERPWELIHIDDKRTKNVAGENAQERRYSFKAVDDCTRFRWTKEYPDKTATSAADFLRYVVSEIKRIDKDAVIGAVLTDNGKAYTCKTIQGRKNHLFERTCIELGIKHKRTKIRRPQTNGKVEYSHWLYDKDFYKKYHFTSFKDREQKLNEFTNYLNYFKPSMAIGGLTPYEKFLKIKNQYCLTQKSNQSILTPILIQAKEVLINKKSIA